MKIRVEPYNFDGFNTFRVQRKILLVWETIYQSNDIDKCFDFIEKLKRARDIELIR